MIEQEGDLPIGHRRLSDLLRDAEFLLVQLMMLHQSGGPHLMRHRAARIAHLNRRLDHLERQLRIRGAAFGIDGELTLGELRRRLARLTDRRRQSGSDVRPERRQTQRRAASDTTQLRLLG